jgi:hypothetical protein
MHSLPSHAFIAASGKKRGALPDNRAPSSLPRELIHPLDHPDRRGLADSCCAAPPMKSDTTQHFTAGGNVVKPNLAALGASALNKYNQQHDKQNAAYYANHHLTVHGNSPFLGGDY